ncbi:MAG: glycosyltransferase family 2 protein [Cryomorphaceae bacterium]|jgi:glycosyltransferase involved in cell wall biosynthesis|nr:glycosyltransferase family 2 protein [Cryomorphaceae bacterium]MBT6935210.1 glycosyltransferase family 2 protein [Cryomorphaceae bacterium]MBT7546092.1 glycosyltransferase family 2 protein [Cryomorphaceae bacterium]
MDVSIIIPLLNESDSLKELNSWIFKSFENLELEIEIIYIDDGSDDSSWKIIEELANTNNNVKGISFTRNYGKSQALRVGFSEAKGEYVATLDADLQDSPEEIPIMINKLINSNLDMISGWKKKRYDSFFLKRIPSSFFNFVARIFSRINLNDFNCGIKVYKKEVIKSINLYADMHRFIPILAKNEGYNKIGEHIVMHQPRKYGRSKFGNERFIRGFLDIITLWFINKFGRRPMHFFGSLGTLMIFVGILFTMYLGYNKLFIDTSSRLITNRPEFYIALITLVLGVQFFIAGFISEIILKNNVNKDNYSIKNKTF